MIVVLPETASAGCALFGVDPDSLRSIGGTDGAVYACRKGSRAHVIKFTPTSEEVNLAQLEERLTFMQYLAQNGVPLATPDISEQGRTFEILHYGDTRYVVTLTLLAPGRHPTPRNAYDWNDALFTLWGKVMGRMHALTRKYPLWERAAGTDPGTSIDDWVSEHHFFANWNPEPDIIRHWMPFYDALQALPRDRTCYGLIHNDLHQFNFLYAPDARSGPLLTVIDFDVCAYHWFVTDIGIAIYHAVSGSSARGLHQREERAKAFSTPFMNGYAQENDLDTAWLARLPLFTAYREVLIYIALTNSWANETLSRWQSAFLAEKRRRILTGEPFITSIE